GIVTTGFALIIAVVALIATFVVSPVAAGLCLAVFCAFMLYFALYSRHRLVANSPDEEFAMLAEAESALK
ncbi:ethanolamine permease, partial [Mycolicibacterium komossense]|nr:ethanolamine permease [Mycolicibacterium komossense]